VGGAHPTWLFFLSLPSEEMAIERVRQRVTVGGHNVPENVVRRRFQKGLINFEELYKSIVDEWVLYDNTGDQPVVIDEGYNQ
jgi:predicted ABC-type ATPase